MAHQSLMVAQLNSDFKGEFGGNSEYRLNTISNITRSAGVVKIEWKIKK